MYDCDDKIRELADAVEKIAKSLKGLYHRRGALDGASEDNVETMREIMKKMKKIKEGKVR